jgi:hypothetical protein
LVVVFGVRYCSYLGGGWFHAFVNLLVALLFGYGMRSCQTSVILNHCIKTQFLVCIRSNVRVGVTELYLQILWVCWSVGSAAVQGWVSVPLWCILLPAGVVGITRLSSIWIILHGHGGRGGKLAGT